MTAPRHAATTDELDVFLKRWLGTMFTDANAVLYGAFLSALQSLGVQPTEIVTYRTEHTGKTWWFGVATGKGQSLGIGNLPGQTLQAGARISCESLVMEDRRFMYRGDTSGNLFYCDGRRQFLDEPDSVTRALRTLTSGPRRIRIAVNAWRRRHGPHWQWEDQREYAAIEAFIGLAVTYGLERDLRDHGHGTFGYRSRFGRRHLLLSDGNAPHLDAKGFPLSSVLRRPDWAN
ncbi:MAG TPA: hypothetical protein VLF67_03880 [Candidatus Saccharimonas sp.]|nr:hypothetical protein [Candidatus Saccharimonas sp.]